MLLLNSGDSRPILENYIRKKYTDKNICYFKKIIQFKCIENKLQFVFPKKFKCNKEYIVFSCIISSKVLCKNPDRKKHRVLFLLDTKNRKLFLFDIHKFNHEGFKPNKLVEYSERFFIKWLDNFFTDISFENYSTDDESLFLKIRDILKDNDDKNIYPLYVLYKIDSIFKGDMKLSKNDINKTRESFLNFLGDYYNKTEKCHEQKITNPETKRCIKLNTKKANFILGIKECKDNKIFNIISNRCIKKTQDYKIDEKYFDITKNVSFKNFLGSEKGKKFVIKYLAMKYPNVDFLPNVIKYRYISSKRELIFPMDIGEFIKNSKTFSIMMLSLSSKPKNKKDNHVGYHLNTLIYNKKRNEVEHFEPHGDELSDDYDTKELYELLKKKFDEYNIKYISPIEFCPRFTKIQSYENKERIFIHKYGYCASWNVFYIDLRMSNPMVSPKNVLKYAINIIHNTSGFKNFIANYENFFRHEYEKINRRRNL